MLTLYVFLDAAASGGGGGGGGNGVCYKFRDGNCDRGDSCRFSHGISATTPNRPKQKVFFNIIFLSMLTMNNNSNNNNNNNNNSTIINLS